MHDGALSELARELLAGIASSQIFDSPTRRAHTHTHADRYTLSFSLFLSTTRIYTSPGVPFIIATKKGALRRTFPSRFTKPQATGVTIPARDVSSAERPENRCTEMRAAYRGELNFVSRLARSSSAPALMPAVISAQITKADVPRDNENVPEVRPPRQ